MGGSVYLVMEVSCISNGWCKSHSLWKGQSPSFYKDVSSLSFQYCNGGDLAEYLHCKFATPLRPYYSPHLTTVNTFHSTCGPSIKGGTDTTPQCCNRAVSSKHIWSSLLYWLVSVAFKRLAVAFPVFWKNNRILPVQWQNSGFSLQQVRSLILRGTWPRLS